MNEKTQSPIEETQYEKRLDDAKNSFEESHNLRPHWCAPFARLYIVSQLLGNTNLPGYIAARQCALAEKSLESRLTAVNCGFAVLVHGLGQSITTKPALKLDSHQLYEELEQVFQDVLIPEGPRVCHAFDNAVILDFRNLEDDVWLYRINALLQESVMWKHKTLDEQIKLIESFRGKHRIE